ncbi:MAG: hypothetical protein JSU65_07095, partial [Candidatus Zixiibacteriota bacterium]
MIRKNLMTLTLIGLSGMALMQLPGCTAVGLTTGCIIDASNPSTGTEVPKSKLSATKRGSRITVVKIDGDKVKGRFVKMSPVEDDDYLAACTTLHGMFPDTSYAPVPEDSIQVTRTDGVKLDCLFSGYDRSYGSTYSWHPASKVRFGADHPCLAIRSDRTSSPGLIALQDIETVTHARNGTTSGATLRNLAGTGQLPLRSAVKIYSRGRVRVIPLDEIALAQTPPRTGGNA